MKGPERTKLEPTRPGPGAEPQLLRTIGPFRVLRLLGEGGMGAVYLGYDDQNHRPVAVKVLSENLAGDKDYVARFQREAQNSALLNHPSIVRGLDVGHDPATGYHYMVLEYVDGPSAHALLDQQGKLPVGDAVHIVLDIARALEHAHSRNVIHRDIKPDNILLTSSGVAKLADLGLAKRTNDLESPVLTVGDKTFGTPYYMPPEQAMSSKNADHRSDLFALGATFYHLLTGVVPFDATNVVEVHDLKLQGRYRPASQRVPSVSRDLDPILARLLAADPEKRYQTASELIVDLERTGLDSGVPSFADRELALRDPYVRERMVTSAQATQPDLSPVAAGVETPPPPSEPHWYVRYTTAEGKIRRVQMSKRTLEQKLREGRLPADTEISLSANRNYRPIKEVEAFREFFRRTQINGSDTARPRVPANSGRESPAQRSSPAHATPEDPERQRWVHVLLAAAALVVLGGIVLAVLLLLS